ncbi:TPA: ASCH domain-containing protein [Vibrio vulnificus]|nr:ASCH domain-containing protein [Vibrio vulnificus]
MVNQMDMRMNNQLPEINLSNDNFQLVLKGRKLTSVRLGHKDVSPGLRQLVNVDTGQKKTINIWYVNRCLLSDLELNDAWLDGFSTVEDLKAELRRCYRRFIHDREPVTQVHFDLVADDKVA